MKVNLSDDVNRLDIDGLIDDTEDEVSRSLMIKSIVEMYGKRMIRSSWINDQVYDQYISTLENTNLRDFCTNF